MTQPAVAMALEGYKVLDVSQMLAGPQCGMRLGDLGADVLKIEPPEGEWQRHHAIADAYVGGETTGLLGMNRNKRSVTLNLKHEEGRELFYRLARQADVVIQNFRHGTAERLGIGYEDLRALNPRLVYCSISGYGEDGPYRNRPGQDLVIQGYAGAMFSAGSKTDRPAVSPIYIMDVMASYQASVGILAALLARGRSGEGQKVGISMFAVGLDAQQQELSAFLNLGLTPPRSDEPLANAWINAPYGVYRSRDGYLTLAMAPLHLLGEALDDDFLRGLTQWSDGTTHRDEVFRICERILPGRSTAEWLDIFGRYNIWAGPVYSYADLPDDPHVKATEMIVEVPHPTIPHLRMPNVPIKLSGTPASIRRHPPLLGEHTGEVLREWLGVDAGEVARLRAAGAI
ncbi:CaiB/BaiF CoA transferase family protein [Deinococcus sp.]|uniref:CaiB/BaiF CoA transferase family protein n=1 Tax=Deinococcus sp. TaxID=47478 RepID=UPI003CC63F75